MLIMTKYIIFFVALASRSLGAVKAIIPYIKVFLQSKLLTKQLVLLNDLDRYSKVNRIINYTIKF